MKTTANYIIVADTETGGLPCKASKGKPEKKAFFDVALCEVALVVIDLNSLKIVSEYEALIQPYKDGLEYNPEAEKVHGLSVQNLKENGEDVKTVYQAIKALLLKYKNPRIGSILCGHNFQLFDVPFFEGLFEFNNDSLWNYVKFVEDTMKLSWYRAIEQENYKLGTCCRLEGVELVDAHRALVDTRANALLMLKYIEHMRGTGGSAAPAISPTRKESRFREKFQLV